MIPSRRGTAEGREREKVKNNPGRHIWLTPLLLAAPFILGLGWAALKYGKTIRNLIHVAIKLVVTK